MKYTIGELTSTVEETDSSEVVIDNLRGWEGRYATEVAVHGNPLWAGISDGTLFQVCSSAQPSGLGLTVYVHTISRRKQWWKYTFAARVPFVLHFLESASVGVKKDFRISGLIRAGITYSFRPRLPVKVYPSCRYGKVVNLRALADRLSDTPERVWSYYYEWTRVWKYKKRVGAPDLTVDCMRVAIGSPKSEPLYLEAPNGKAPELRDLAEGKDIWVPLGWAKDVFALHSFGDTPPRPKSA